VSTLPIPHANGKPAQAGMPKRATSTPSPVAIPYPDPADEERRRFERMRLDRAMERGRMEQLAKTAGMVKEERNKARDDGFRRGYKAGVRWGFVCGVSFTLGVAGVAAIVVGWLA